MIGEHVYLAARYTRRHEMAEYARVLRAAGLIVTSRWHDQEDDVPDDGPGGADTPAAFAARDLEDVEACDTLVLFTDGNSGARGGKHVEFGYAMALGRNLIVVGDRENIFQFVPQVEWYASWDQALFMLTEN